MKKILLDTNAYTRLLRGDQDVLDFLGKSETVYMSIFVLGELYAGFSEGTRDTENRSTLHRFLEKPTVKILNATSDTAEIFGMIRSNLRRNGTPLPMNDVWIAAHGIETGSIIQFNWVKIPSYNAMSDLPC